MFHQLAFRLHPYYEGNRSIEYGITRLNYAFRRRVNPLIRAKVAHRELSHAELAARKRSDTIVILATGTSIAGITPKQWDFIGRHNSFGINMFLAHEFMPDMVHLEVAAPWAYPFCFEEKFYGQALKDPARDYAETPIVFSRQQVAKGFHPKFMPYVFPDPCQVYAYEGFRSLRIPLEKKISPDDLEGYDRDPAKPLLGVRSSLSLLVHFCYRLGFEKIILAGVDLYDKDYFWYDPGRYPEWQWHKEAMHQANAARERLYGFHKVKHGTTRFAKNGREFHSILTFLPAVNDLVLKPAGCELFVANPKSLLAKDLEVHPLADWG